jgi:hypothetical protein
MLANLEKSFIIDLVGDTTGDKFSGTFTVKCVLSKREEMAADVRRRFILGPSPENALNMLASDAFVLGQLSVRVTKSPSWWDRSDGGLELVDMNIIAKVFEEATKAELEFRETISKKAEEATKVLEKTVAKNVPPEEQGGEV